MRNQPSPPRSLTRCAQYPPSGRVAQRLPDQIEIQEGLEEGDRVVTTAVSQLREGLRVIAR